MNGALRIYEELKSAREQAEVLSKLASVYEAKGEPERAKEFQERERAADPGKKWTR